MDKPRPRRITPRRVSKSRYKARAAYAVLLTVGIGLLLPLALLPLPEAAASQIESEQVSAGSERQFADMTFVWIPPGVFMMGSLDRPAEKDRRNSEGPIHPVTISKGFWLGKCEVTVKNWQDIVGTTRAEGNAGPDEPLNHVNYADCEAFLSKLNGRGEGQFRLPTEAEWEYACRAGTATAYSFGDDEAALGEYSWNKFNWDSRQHPVGEKKPNAWGLHDMHGSLWEICQDSYDTGYYHDSPRIDPLCQKDNAGKVIRGGSLVDATPRSAVRTGYDPNERNPCIGFRVCRMEE